VSADSKGVPEARALARCASHRARRRLFSAFGRLPEHVCWDCRATGGYFWMPPGRLAEAQVIQGVTRARPCPSIGRRGTSQ
jgi:hypothetical protein